MADVRDYMIAAKASEDALWSLETYAGQVESGEKPGDPVVCMALVGCAIATAIYRFEVRMDYVLHEIQERSGYGRR